MSTIERTYPNIRQQQLSCGADSRTVVAVEVDVKDEVVVEVVVVDDDVAVVDVVVEVEVDVVEAVEVVVTGGRERAITLGGVTSARWRRS
jgi:hypothetical protein